MSFLDSSFKMTNGEHINCASKSIAIFGQNAKTKVSVGRYAPISSIIC